jgi:hypothetical protein
VRTWPLVVGGKAVLSAETEERSVSLASPLLAPPLSENCLRDLELPLLRRPREELC